MTEAATLPATQVSLRNIHPDIPLIAATSLHQVGRRRRVLPSIPEIWTLHRLGDGPHAFLSHGEAALALSRFSDDPLADLPSWVMQRGTRAHDQGGVARVRLQLGTLRHLRQTVVIGLNPDRGRGNAVMHANGSPVSDGAWRATVPTEDLDELYGQFTRAMHDAERQYLEKLHTVS